MRRSGMSPTAIRRAFGLSEREAVAAGILFPQIPPRAGPGVCGVARAAARPGPAERGPRLAEVLEAVAREGGLSSDLLRAPSQVRRVVRLRHLAMYLLREICPGASLPAIGYFLERDHTSVLYGCRRTEARMLGDLELRAIAMRIRRRWPDPMGCCAAAARGPGK